MRTATLPSITAARLTLVISAGLIVGLFVMPEAYAYGGAAFVYINADDPVDSDGDGIPDVVELALGTDPNNPDSSGDGIPDGWRLRYGLDPRANGDVDDDISKNGLTVFEAFLWGVDPWVKDTDGDGFWDGFEVNWGSCPANPTCYPHTGILGDVNRNGRVDAQDLQLVINAVLGMPTPVPANVTSSGGVNALDIQKVINIVLGVE